MYIMPSRSRRRKHGRHGQYQKESIGSVTDGSWESVRSRVRDGVRKDATTSVIACLIVEFVGSFVMTIIFIKSWHVATMIGGLLGKMFHYFITAALAGGLTYVMYPFSGGYISSNNVLFALFSWSDRKLGNTKKDRIWSAIAYIVAHIFGSTFGAMLASVLPKLPEPIVVSWPMGYRISSIFTSVFASCVHTLIVGCVMDFCWTSYETVCLRVIKDCDTGHFEEKPMRYHSMNGYYGLVVFFSRFAIGSCFVSTSAGVLNMDIAFFANAWASILSLSYAPIIDGAFYLLSNGIGSVIAGIIYFVFRKALKPNMSRKKR